MDIDKTDDSVSRESVREKEEISNLVKGCMRALNLPPDDYSKSLQFFGYDDMNLSQWYYSAMLFIYSLYGMVKVQFIQCAFRKE